MIEELENPCAYCIYSSEACDSLGHEYFQCCLDDDPDLYANAMCCMERE